MLMHWKQKILLLVVQLPLVACTTLKESTVPFVIDVLNTRKMLDHTYLVYGKIGRWPLSHIIEKG